MSAAAAPPSGFRRPPLRPGLRGRSRNGCISMSMKDRPGKTSHKPQVVVAAAWDKGDVVGEAAPKQRISSDPPSELRFDRLQPSEEEEECSCRHRRAFAGFVAREALLDEEYWTAAWLRAESNWEDHPTPRYVDNFKRQFAEREFNALKKRCNRQNTDKSICIIAVKKKERNVKRTVLSSIVGTLDINIRRLLCGETFPGELVKAPFFSNTYRTDQPSYGYVSNLCVTKHARRQGIASNMLLLAREAAKSYGANKIFVHVNKDNIEAQKLYDKIDFSWLKLRCPIHHQKSRNTFYAWTLKRSTFIDSSMLYVILTADSS